MDDSSFHNNSFAPSNNPLNSSYSFPDIHYNTGAQNIGCTVVVHQPNQAPALENFFHMPISTTLLAKRSGTHSLYLDSLILAIRAQIFCSPVGTVKPLINALIHNHPLDGLVSGNHTVTIATCRIPDFSNIQDTGLGYMQLPGTLDHLSLYIPDSSDFMPHGRELLSIGSILQENAHVKSFFNIWQPSGMQLDFHFILLFLLRPVRLATASDFNTFLFPSLSPDISSSPLFQPIGISTTEALVTPPDIAPTSANSFTATPSYASSVASLDFSQILHHTEIIDSTYENKRNGIVAQVRNWRAMKSTLVKLSVVSDDKRRVVLGKFGWTAITFKHKSLWYEWALEAAKKTWRRDGCTPLSQKYTLSQEYKQWRGIVYLFKPNGAIDRNYIPKRISVNLDERWAAEVTQTKIDFMRTTISAYLV